MKIKTLMPSAFGKFHAAQPVEFSDGLNIIRGDNEAGKSTLGAFILGMFYGFKKEGKTRISRHPEYDRYRPWLGNDYRGTMTYEEGERTYRIERSFDPDSVRIYDDNTGEEITRSFSQDSRKEYDFALRHLGLSAKEFRNTVWIGQLGSPQEPGLGTEIQGKLESILQGGSMDVPLVRALSLLADEKAKIKAPRSVKAKLDVIQLEMAELQQELKFANAREEELRGWLIEASDLSKEKVRLESLVSEGEGQLGRLRLAMLSGLLREARDIENQASEVRARLTEAAWAKDVPPGSEQQYQASRQEKDIIFRRAAEAKEESGRLRQRVQDIQAKLAATGALAESGVDEPALASLYSRYLSAKATAFKSERSANDARRELRASEEEGQAKGYPDEEFDKDILKEAEDLQETVFLTEKAKSQMDVEAERARSAVTSRNPGGASGWLYALSLGVLGIAVILTVMAMPMSLPAFGLAVVLFAVGLYRQSAMARLRRADEQALEEKEREVQEQGARIEAAKRALSDYLGSLGARSVEELRSVARELGVFRARLRNARDRYEIAHKYWFEASQDLSMVEKELLAALKSSGCLEAGEAVTDSAVDSFRRKLASVATEKQNLKTVGERLAENDGLLAELEKRLSAVSVKERDLLAACLVDSVSELESKLIAKKDYDEAARTFSELTGRRNALLSGRDLAEVEEEVARLSNEMDEGWLRGGEPASIDVLESQESSQEPIGTVASEKEYESRRRGQDDLKVRLGEINSRLAGLENGIRLRTEEGRSASEIEEELTRKQAVEEELSDERDALDLAQSTLNDLSKSLRREFAPALNKRVGEILGKVTSGRYADVKISPDLEMSVVHPETGNQTGAALLSGGAMDQCYFALRVAIAEAITKKAEFPFFLDDSFVQYDDKRLAGALEILAALAVTHQILVFSCHGREEAMAQDLGLEYRRVSL